MAQWIIKKLHRLGINAITASAWNCRITWHWAECYCRYKNLLRALELTWADSLQGVEMTPNTQDGNFLLHMSKSTLSTQCFPDVQYAKQSNPGSERNMHFVFAKPPCFFFISFTRFDSAGDGGNLSCWHFLPLGYILVPPPSTLSKMHGWSNKKAILCCTMQGSHPWTALKFALMPSFQEDGAYCRH